MTEFNTYAEISAYVNAQISKLGKGPYTSSAEYHTLRPIMMEMARVEGIVFRKRRSLKGVDLRPTWLKAAQQFGA